MSAFREKRDNPFLLLHSRRGRRRGLGGGRRGGGGRFAHLLVMQSWCRRVNPFCFSCFLCSCAAAAVPSTQMCVHLNRVPGCVFFCMDRPSFKEEQGGRPLFVPVPTLQDGAIRNVMLCRRTAAVVRGCMGGCVNLRQREERERVGKGWMERGEASHLAKRMRLESTSEGGGRSGSHHHRFHFCRL